MSGFTVSNAKSICKNSLVGSFDLQMPSGMKINSCLLLEKNGKRWIGFPSREWQKADGTRDFFPIIEFVDRSTSDKFQAAVLPLAVDALLVGQS
jgi:hypothetical protein